MAGLTGYITKLATSTVDSTNGLCANFSDANACYLANSTEYDVFGDDWTFEFWFNWYKGNTMSSSSIGIANNSRASIYDVFVSGWTLGFTSPDYPYDGSTLTNLYLTTDLGGISSSAFNATSIPQNTWHHIAIVRNGSSSNNVTFYLDGVSVDVADDPGASAGAGASVIFGQAASAQFRGDPGMKISNFRLSAEAVYTEDFTPSTTPLVALPSTKILTFQSGLYNTGSTGGDLTNSGIQMRREGPWHTLDKEFNDFGDYFIRRDLIGLTVPKALTLYSEEFSPGYVYAWGDNTYGQIGDGTQTYSNTAINIDSNIYTDIASSNYTNLGIRSDGTLWTWGNNTLGLLGVANSDTSYQVSLPIQITSGGNNWKKLCEAKASVVGAIKTDGTLWLWGSNSLGQCAQGNGGPSSLSEPTQIYGGGTWKQVAMSSITGVGLKTDGTIWGWGYSQGNKIFMSNNPSGTTLGELSVSYPVQTGNSTNDWYKFAMSWKVVVAIKNDRTLWTWGLGQYGCRGDGTVDDSLTPTQIGTDTWIDVAVGGSQSASCAAIRSDGTLWTWGYNGNGELGDGTITDRSSPVQVVSGGTNWKNISTGVTGISAIKTDDSLWSWGNVIALDGTDTQPYSSPVLASLGSWQKVIPGGIGIRSSLS